MRSIFSRRAAALTALALLALFAVVGEATVAVNPTKPVVDVPFTATITAGGGTRLFASLDAACTRAVSSTCTKPSTACTFTVAFTAVKADMGDASELPLYWCNNVGQATSEPAFTMYRIRFDPSYVYFQTATTLTFNDATPVGTVVGFFKESNCASMVEGSTSATLTESRTLEYTLSTGFFVSVCAVSIPTVTGTPVTKMRLGTVFGTNPYNLNTLSGLRYQTVLVSMDATPRAVSLSSSPDCIPLAQDAADVTVTTGPVPLYVTVPQGDYFFCAVIAADDLTTGDKAPFVPAMNKFHVGEYRSEPSVAFAGIPVTLTLELDAATALPGGTQVSVSRSATCKAGEEVVAWTAAGPAITVPTAGSYFVCVRGASDPTNSMARASPLEVVPAPTLSLTDPATPRVRGLRATTTVQRTAGAPTGPLTIAISATADCENVLSEATAAAGATSTVSLLVPYTAPQEVMWCMSTPAGVAGSEEAGSVLFPVPNGAMATRKFDLTTPPLRVDRATTIGLDAAANLPANTRLRVVQSASNSCSSGTTINMPMSGDAKSAGPVTFTKAGQWLLCANTVGTTAAADYAALRALDVFGDAVVAPVGVISGLPSELSLSALPPSAAFTARTEAVGCAGSTGNLATGTTNAAGAAKMTLSTPASPAPQQLLLCAAYPTEVAGVADVAVEAAATIMSEPPKATPAAVVGGQSAHVRIIVPGATLLAGGAAYALPADTGRQAGEACPTAPPAEAIMLPLTVPTAPSTAMPYVTMDASVAEATQMEICVGLPASSRYTSAGVVTVVAPLETTTTPADAVAGLPVRVTLQPPQGMSLADLGAARFAVVADVAGCGTVTAATTLASGAVAANGQLDSFIAPLLWPDGSVASGAVALCIAPSADVTGGAPADDANSFNYGGPLELNVFKTKTQYVLKGRANPLRAAPVASATAELFLAPGTSAADTTTICKDADSFYYTDAELELPTATPAGTYALCQRWSGSTVGAAGQLVRVLSPWSLTLPTTPMYQHDPFSVTLVAVGDEGPQLAAATYTVVAVPPEIGCAGIGSAADKGANRFSMKLNTPTMIRVDGAAASDSIVFCARPDLGQAADEDADDGMGAAPFYAVSPETKLLPFVTPGIIEEGVATAFTTLTTSGRAKLTLTSTCDGTLSSTAADITNNKVTLTLPTCKTPQASVYYCEQPTGEATYQVRGHLPVLRRTGCTAVGSEPSIAKVTTAPGVAVSDLGLDPSLLVNGRLSASSRCTGLLDPAVTVPYPQMGETLVYFVCANPVGATAETWFTTDAATLTVDNWAVTPTAVPILLEGGSATSLTITYPTQWTGTFIGDRRDCSGGSVAAAPDLGTTVRRASFGAVVSSGLLYVCASPDGGARLVAVAAFLAVAPPTVVSADAGLIIGARFTAKLRAPLAGGSALYSLVPGEDAGYAYAPYFISADRAAFLSSDSCKTTLAGTQPVAAGADGVVVISTEAVVARPDVVALCAGTPAGPIITLDDIPVAAGEIYPLTAVSGIQTQLFAPFLVGVTLRFSSGRNCDNVVDSMPPATVSAAGYAMLSATTAGAPATPGVYAICRGDRPAGGNTALVAVLTVVSPTQFGIDGRTFVVAIPSTMYLLQDLRTADLLEGFSTTRDCADRTIVNGAWEASTTTAVTVTAQRATSPLYLCAKVPMNGSIVSLPTSVVGNSAASSLHFVAPSVSLPTGGPSGCGKVEVSKCYIGSSLSSGAQPKDGEIVLVDGDCCAPYASRAAMVVGRSDSYGGGSCHLHMDEKRAAAVGTKKPLNICVWDLSNSQFCATMVQNVYFKSACVTSNSMSGGTIAGIVVGVVLGTLLLILLIALLIWCCCCRNADDEETTTTKKSKKETKDEGPAAIEASMPRSEGSGAIHLLTWPGAAASASPSYYLPGSETRHPNPLLYVPVGAYDFAASGDGRVGSRSVSSPAAAAAAAGAREGSGAPPTTAASVTSEQLAMTLAERERAAKTAAAEAQPMHAPESLEVNSVPNSAYGASRFASLGHGSARHAAAAGAEDSHSQSQSSFGRLGSASSSASRTPLAALQLAEEAARDEAALAEARARYTLRLQRLADEDAIVAAEKEARLYDDNDGPYSSAPSAALSRAMLTSTGGTPRDAAEGIVLEQQQPPSHHASRSSYRYTTTYTTRERVEVLPIESQPECEKAPRESSFTDQHDGTADATAQPYVDVDVLEEASGVVLEGRWRAGAVAEASLLTSLSLLEVPEDEADASVSSWSRMSPGATADGAQVPAASQRVGPAAVAAAAEAAAVAAPSRPAPEAVEGDFSTTQHFHDELVSTLQREAGRRRRLQNMEAATRDELEAQRRQSLHSGDDATGDGVAESYVAPSAPAALPRLPQRPRGPTGHVDAFNEGSLSPH